MIRYRKPVFPILIIGHLISLVNSFEKIIFLRRELLIMTFGEKVKKARKEQGLTQTQLGEKIGVSRRTITSYEAEAFPPRTREL